MPKQVTQARTPDAFRAHLPDFERERGTGDPGWLRRLRREALERFEEWGLPTTRVEAWRKTSLQRVAGTSWRLARGSPEGVSVKDVAPHSLVARLSAFEAVFVNGRFSPQLSQLEGLSRGVTVGSLSETLAEDPDAVHLHLAKHARFEAPEHALVALNTAFIGDGAWVRVPRGVVMERPIHLLFLAAAEGGPTVVHPRNLVVCGEASQATVVETYAGATDAGTFTNAVTELVAEPSAVVEHVKLQREALSAVHAHQLALHEERDANVIALCYSEGGALVRNEVRAGLDDEGAAVRLDGLFLGVGSQHVDNHTVIDHAKPHGTSLELYKGIMDDEAHGIFTGSVLVRPGAQQTSSKQENRNLLLSDKAIIETTPQLEIHADDVKCAHGSTIGQLEEGAVFYMRSRGIDEATARRMLTQAFAAEVLEELRSEPIRQLLTQAVARWFDARRQD